MSYLTSVVESTIQFFHSALGDWALAIFLLALNLKVILLPIQYFNFKQQRLLNKFQPQLNALSLAYKDDPLTLHVSFL